MTALLLCAFALVDPITPARLNERSRFHLGARTRTTWPPRS